MESLAELLFVLASTDRLQVLSYLREGKEYRLSDIAQRLNSSMQEASKHVTRLRDQNIVEKNPSNGYYTLTTLGDEFEADLDTKDMRSSYVNNL